MANIISYKQEVGMVLRKLLHYDGMVIRKYLLSGFGVGIKEGAPGALCEPAFDDTLPLPRIPETVMVIFAGKDENVDKRCMKKKFLKDFQR